MANTSVTGSSLGDRNVLLRYRFEKSEQLQRHVHYVQYADASGPLLFFPDGSGRLPVKTRVLLEIVLQKERQQTMLRGSVRSRAAGQGVEGAWLELAWLGPLGHWNGSASVSTRSRRRLAVDLPVRIAREGGPQQMARLADVSLGGARLAGIANELPPGSEAGLALFTPSGNTPPDLGRVRVLWAKRGQVGVSFAPSDEASRRSVATLVEAATARWSDAFEHVHLSVCRCAQGGPTLDPDSPRTGV